ncbi:hypothetical protein NADFUDRAFT_51899 [Nadsonia fulvescens var. elongata DSM 6958]|uniref:Uncharacterized protein n=1 Tax=Nadsonia fulvescens var. elongata DSM 6958 TaxID=857566 RepID=A0A1E3PIM9_9ASCO|nr:hypothetical protein NADFUDRAFT_51899 [Nadsonia fulvescens var. elongata DSM 6958]
MSTSLLSPRTPKHHHAQNIGYSPPSTVKGNTIHTQVYHKNHNLINEGSSHKFVLDEIKIKVSSSAHIGSPTILMKTLTPTSIINHSKTSSPLDINLDDIDPIQLEKVIQIQQEQEYASKNCNYSDSGSNGGEITDPEDSLSSIDILLSPSSRRRKVSHDLPYYSTSDEEDTCHRDRIKRRFLRPMHSAVEPVRDQPNIISVPLSIDESEYNPQLQAQKGSYLYTTSETDTDTEVQRVLMGSQNIQMKKTQPLPEIETDTDTEVQRYLTRSCARSTHESKEGTATNITSAHITAATLQSFTPSPTFPKSLGTSLLEQYHAPPFSPDDDLHCSRPLPLPSYTNFTFKQQRPQTPPSSVKNYQTSTVFSRPELDLHLNRGVGPIIEDPLSPSLNIIKRPIKSAVITKNSIEKEGNDDLLKSLLCQNRALLHQVRDLQNELSRYRGQ